MAAKEEEVAELIGAFKLDEPPGEYGKRSNPAVRINRAPKLKIAARRTRAACKQATVPIVPKGGDFDRSFGFRGGRGWGGVVATTRARTPVGAR